MKRIHLLKFIIVQFIAIIFFSCNKAPELSLKPEFQVTTESSNAFLLQGIVPDDESLFDDPLSHYKNKNHEDSKFLFTASNELDGNRILSFKIKNDGTLEPISKSEHGGLGTGKPLQSQGPMGLSEKKNYLYVVNAESNSISAFRILKNGSVVLFQTIHSGGIKPVSLSTHKNLLFVLNAGNDQINGFHISEDGKLIPAQGSQKMLSGTGVLGAQISFSPNGNTLIVTEKASDKISTYQVKEDGSISEHAMISSIGQTPYGFAFAGNHFLIVSNAWHGGKDASTATSYNLNGNGQIKNAIVDIPNYQTSACWATTSRFGNYAYISNGNGNSISSFYVSESGALQLINSIAAPTGKGPRDMVISKNNLFLYVINVDHNIEIFQRKPYGQLQAIGKADGLPSSASGLITN